MRVVVVTGLSGAGKSTALRSLEDIGYYCADNLPLPLVPSFVDTMAAVGAEDVAISVDARQHEFLDQYRGQVEALRTAGHTVEVLFLEAADDVLLRRYSETRRRHPLAGDELSDGIRRDREVLALLRVDASVTNTESLNVHQLKEIIVERYGRAEGTLAVTLQSFGFKHGLPADSDLVFDVRFLPNPYFVPELRDRDGRESPVSEYVLGTDEGAALVDHIETYLLHCLPGFAKEGKLYLTVSIGCTGGRHRSVALVEELHKRLDEPWGGLIRHRDLNRGM